MSITIFTDTLIILDGVKSFALSMNTFVYYIYALFLFF